MEVLVSSWPGSTLMRERDAVTVTLSKFGRRMDVRFAGEKASFHVYEVAPELGVLLSKSVPFADVCWRVSAYFRRVRPHRFCHFLFSEFFHFVPLAQAEALHSRAAFFAEALREFGGPAAAPVTDATTVIVIATPVASLRLVISWTVRVSSMGDIVSQVDVLPACEHNCELAKTVASSISPLFSVLASRFGCMSALRVIFSKLRSS